jgi:hypothetical protein
MLEHDDAADRLLDKLRAFVNELPEDERLVFAALVGPAIELAHGNTDEVSGFDLTWDTHRLPEALVDAIRGRDLRVEGW